MLIEEAEKECYIWENNIKKAFAKFKKEFPKGHIENESINLYVENCKSAGEYIAEVLIFFAKFFIIGFFLPKFEERGYVDDKQNPLSYKFLCVNNSETKMYGFEIPALNFKHTNDINNYLNFAKIEVQRC